MILFFVPTKALAYDKTFDVSGSAGEINVYYYLGSLTTSGIPFIDFLQDANNKVRIQLAPFYRSDDGWIQRTTENEYVNGSLAGSTRWISDLSNYYKYFRIAYYPDAGAFRYHQSTEENPVDWGCCNSWGTIVPFNFSKIHIAYDDINDLGNIKVTSSAPNTITVSSNPVQTNTSISTNATFTDEGDSHIHTAIWNWGDGATSSGTLQEPNGSNPGLVSGTHTYSVAGVYQVLLIVSDTDGGVRTQSYSYISVYNPTPQGLFSAGQKFTSPAGAYTADLNKTGNVQFGLSYKYQGEVPVSHKQFSMKFKAANFEFNATEISSLVISNGIGTLRGTGTVDGQGLYNFLVVGKEATDSVRIQIKDTSGNTIYDTQQNESDSAEPITSVTAGTVLSH